MNRTLCIKAGKQDIMERLPQWTVLVASLRDSRKRARQAAIWELFFLLEPLEGVFITNGPLGEVSGQIAFFVPQNNLSAIRERLVSTGYCDSFYTLDFETPGRGKSAFHWKGLSFSVEPFFKQDKTLYEEQSSHRRDFALRGEDGTIKEVTGYRGDGSETGRRALPVEDARLLVNLAAPQPGEILLDPFAGTGGILVQAAYREPSLTLLSGDIEPALEPGLSRLATLHQTADARELVVPAGTVDMLVSEVPFSAMATEAVGEALGKLLPALHREGRIALLCGPEQAAYLEQVLTGLRLHQILERPVYRQGGQVVVSLWHCSGQSAKALRPLAEAIRHQF